MGSGGDETTGYPWSFGMKKIGVSLLFSDEFGLREGMNREGRGGQHSNKRKRKKTLKNSHRSKGTLFDRPTGGAEESLTKGLSQCRQKSQYLSVS